MTQEEILKAFDNRWRIKGKYIEDGIILYNSEQGVSAAIKELCLDFFKTGVLLGEGFSVAEDEQYGTVIYKHDPILDTDDKGFSEWWDMYDLKCNRASCEKKWNKLTSKERYACLAATPAYVASTPDKQYRKRPLTYLNQKAWNDEIIPRNNGTNKPTLDQQRTDKLADILTK